MNCTIVSEGKLKQLKNLAKEIETLNKEIMCFGGNDNLHFKVRILTEQLTNLILEL